MTNDIWNENINTVYTDVIEIFEANSDLEPIDPSKIIRLNDSGSVLTMYDSELGNISYQPAVFEFNEPDRNSINDETGSLSIAGVTSNYIEMLNEVVNGNTLVVRIGLVDYDKAKASVTTHDTDYWLSALIDYVASNTSVSSATATLQVSFKSGSMQLSFYISKWRYSNVEFPCLFG